MSDRDYFGDDWDLSDDYALDHEHDLDEPTHCALCRQRFEVAPCGGWDAERFAAGGEELHLCPDCAAEYVDEHERGAA